MSVILETKTRSFADICQQAAQQPYRQVVILNWMISHGRKLMPTHAAFLLPQDPEKDLNEIKNLASASESNVDALYHFCSKNYKLHDFMAADDKTILPAELTNPKLDGNMIAIFHQEGETLVQARIKPSTDNYKTYNQYEPNSITNDIIASLNSSKSIKQMTVKEPQGYPDNRFQVSFAKAAYMPA